MRGKKKVKKSATLVRITSLIDMSAMRIEGIIAGVRSRIQETADSILTPDFSLLQLVFHPPPGHFHKHIFEGGWSDVEVEQGVPFRLQEAHQGGYGHGGRLRVEKILAVDLAAIDDGVELF